VKRVSKYTNVRGIDRFDVKELFNSNLHMNLFFLRTLTGTTILKMFLLLYAMLNGMVLPWLWFGNNTRLLLDWGRRTGTNYAPTAYSSKQLQHCTSVSKHLTHRGNTDKRSRIRDGF
jgi:hypothetical protein